jgi:hypothetical protein
MKASTIFSGTLSFCWLKLALGLADVLIGALLFGIIMGIAMLTGSGEVGALLLFVWIGVWGAVHWVIKHYLTYLVKAGHVAVIAQSFKDGAIPANPVAFGKNMVKERFATSNVYFIIDRLVAGAVKQLQRVFGKVTGLLGNIPGGDTLRKIGDLFIDISLGYIDECCLGYTFYHTEQNAYKSAADGVVVYAQNWKQLLKDGAKTTFVVILTIVAVTLLAFFAIGGLFRLMEWNMLVAVILSLFVSFVVKHAFVDSWILVKMMSSYFTAASTTVISFDLYGKLCNLSGKFKELFKKGGEQPVYTAPMAAATAIHSQAAAPQIPAQSAVPQSPSSEGVAPATNARFCRQCGARNEGNIKFCPKCGASMSV